MPFICILAAHQSNKIQPFAPDFSPWLIPFQGKALLSHLVEKYPAATFVVTLRPEEQTIRSYLELAHPGASIQCVHATGSPREQLLQAKAFLPEPFLLVQSVGLWREELPLSGDWSAQNAYSGMPLGLSRVSDTQTFFAGLEESEYFLSRWTQKVRPLFLQSHRSAEDAAKFERWCQEAGEHPFRKENEAVYLLGGQVIKFHADQSVHSRKVRRSQLLAGIVPQVRSVRENFYSYSYEPGPTLADDLVQLPRVLDFCLHALWKPARADLDREKFFAAAFHFYRDKTLNRWQLAERNVSAQARSWVKEYLFSQNWIRWAEGSLAAQFHGDLTIDNVILSPVGARLIDHRGDFGGLEDVGDLYYDLGKLVASLWLPFRYLAAPDCKPVCHKGEIALVREFVKAQGWDWERVAASVPLMYLNMACLSPEPARSRLLAAARAWHEDQNKFSVRGPVLNWELAQI